MGAMVVLAVARCSPVLNHLRLPLPRLGVQEWSAITVGRPGWRTPTPAGHIRRRILPASSSKSSN
jgi:hypothetical protein